MAIRDEPAGTAATRPRVIAADEILAFQNQILRGVAIGRPLAEVLDRLVQFIEAQSGSAMCSILLFDEKEMRLRFIAGPSLPRAYNDKIDGLVVDAQTGTCGAAVHRKERVIVTDTATDPLWSRFRSLASQFGLAACTSVPIFDSKQRVMGTFAFYYRVPRAPDARDLELIEISRDLAGVAIERELQERELARVNGDLERRVRERTGELEAFTFSVSHDLRAPLRAIEGRLAILVEDFGDSLPEGSAEHIDAARRNARSMSGLIDDLLEFSQTSLKPMRKAWVQPAQIAADALDQLREQRGDLAVEVHTPPLPACWADRTLLTQVYVNLLSNAIKYSRDRSPAKIEIGARNSAGKVEYFVRDNGIGFDMRYAEQIFGVFQRLHSQESYEGSGIGLAVVARIVQRHGGRVWAEARPGEGACFYFTIPGDPVE